MRLLPALAPLGLAAAFAAAPAQGYTPESGIWWNPNASGGGFVIEIQDNFMALSYFGGDEQGRATWWTAGGLLTGNALFENVPLNRTVGSQCIGCPYTGFPQVVADGGTVTVRFDPDDNTKATVTWSNGVSVPIERQQFYLKRWDDPAPVPMKTTMMLGEWQVVMDFASAPGAGFDFYGDVIVLDDFRFNAQSNRWEFIGCRADNSLVAGCSNFALANHFAWGYYDAPSGLHVLYVQDTPQNRLLYLIDTATDSGIGEITVFPNNANPANYDAYPMRSFRTASRKFVQEGFGPAKAAAAEAGGVVGGLSDRLFDAGNLPLPKATPQGRFDRTPFAGDLEGFDVRRDERLERDR